MKYYIKYFFDKNFIVQRIGNTWDIRPVLKAYDYPFHVQSGATVSTENMTKDPAALG